MAPQANVPFLPGHVMHDLTKTNHRRPQTLVYRLNAPADNIATQKVPMDAATIAALTATQPVEGAPTAEERREAKEEMRNTYKPAIQPAWLKHDRQVLRFFAYYQEPVTECAVENFRIRNCTMCYYLEDGTMQITEPKVENSGIWPQGPFVKRHRIPKGDDGIFGPEDLKMGAAVTIYARTFRIVSADEFTKWFYEQAGMDVGVEEEAPMDNFFETQVWKKEMTTTKTGYPKDVMYSKEYTELKLGGNRKNNKLQQFLENDGKVLRFYAYWEDNTRYGARQYFVVHYFLADDTVEILNSYARNSGRWENPVFFTRGPLKLQPSIAHTPGMVELATEFLRPKDLVVGKTVPVYGREFFIYNCDDATKAFSEDYLGIAVNPIEVPDEEKVHFKLQYPPKTNFGSEEDSLGSCLMLRPKPPRKDLVKLMTNSDRILRYEARPENHMPEDAARRFIVGVFLADDTIAVWEVRQRNSGQCEGKFRERGHTLNSNTGENFKPADFFVGSRMTISAMPFVIMRADEYTLKYMESHPDQFIQSSMEHIAAKLRGLEEQAKESLPPQASISPEDLRDVVGQYLGFGLTDQEIITVLRNCCVAETAEIQMGELYALIRAGGVGPKGSDA